MSVEESKHDLSASELKAKKKEEKRRLKESKKETVQDVDSTLKDKSEKKSKKKSKKRSRDDDDEEEEKQRNKREDDDRIDEDNGAEKRSRKKRKSVSFSDNVDVQTIEHKDQTNESSEDKKTDGDIDNSRASGNEEQDRERRKKEKREKRKQRQKHDGEKTTTITTTEGDKPTTDSVDKSILSYLSQYYNDRASWKFQKIRETQLLKHVFSLEHVPSEYSPALLAYLKGLKSEGARTRLRKGAQDVIKYDEKRTTATSEATDENTTDETNGIAKLPALPESLREAYGDAVYRFKGNLNAGIKDLNEGVSLTAPDGDDNENGEIDTNVLARLEHRKRAEMVMWTVSGKLNKFSSSAGKQQEKQTETESEPTETAAASASASVAKKDKQKAPARKKRKNRTMIVEISSSSESSDSDSD